jgi:hypothetical protein
LIWVNFCVGLYNKNHPNKTIVQPIQDILAQLQELSKLVQNFDPADKLHHEVLKRKSIAIHERILLLDDLSEFDTAPLSKLFEKEEKPLLIDSHSLDKNENDGTLELHQTEEETSTPAPLHYHLPQTDDRSPLQTLEELALLHDPPIETEIIAETESSINATPPNITEPTDETKSLPTNLFTPSIPPISEISLHEKLSAHIDNKPALADKLGKNVESLKAAISLNQKIAFVNILFQENVVDYAKSIEKLNQSSNIDEALRYFTELKHLYGWESTNELVKDLQKLIEKRFSE